MVDESPAGGNPPPTDGRRPPPDDGDGPLGDEDGPLGDEDGPLGDELLDDPLEPGSPSLENAAFVVLGVVFAVVVWLLLLP